MLWMMLHKSPQISIKNVTSILIFFTSLLEENIKSDYFQDWDLRNAWLNYPLLPILHYKDMQNHIFLSNTLGVLFCKRFFQHCWYTSHEGTLLYTNSELECRAKITLNVTAGFYQHLHTWWTLIVTSSYLLNFQFTVCSHK